MLKLMPCHVMQVVDTSLDEGGGAPYVDPSLRAEEELLEPLRRQLGSLPHLTRLLLRGPTPSGFALSELPPLRVGSTVALGLLIVSSIYAAFACLRRLWSVPLRTATLHVKF